MGTHVHDPRSIRRGVLRVVPPVLCHEFRRGILGMDDHPVLLRYPGRIVRVPHESRQPARPAYLPEFPTHKRYRCPPLFGRGGRFVLHRKSVRAQFRSDQRYIDPPVDGWVRRPGTRLRPEQLHDVHQSFLGRSSRISDPYPGGYVHQGQYRFPGDHRPHGQDRPARGAFLSAFLRVLPAQRPIAHRICLRQ